MKKVGGVCCQWIPDGGELSAPGEAVSSIEVLDISVQSFAKRAEEVFLAEISARGMAPEHVAQERLTWKTAQGQEAHAFPPYGQGWPIFGEYGASADADYIRFAVPHWSDWLLEHLQTKLKSLGRGGELDLSKFSMKDQNKEQVTAYPVAWNNNQAGATMSVVSEDKFPVTLSYELSSR